MKRMIGLLILGVPNLVFAHTGHGDSSFLSGILHPVNGLDHLLVMLAVGLLATQYQGRSRWLLPIAFVAMMLFGFLLSAAGFGLPQVESVIAVSVMVLGACLAFNQILPLLLAACLVGIFGLFHGAAHGTEVGQYALMDYAIGFLVMTVGLHVIGFYAANVLQRVVVRLSGGVMALAGLVLFFA